ncbi:MAG: biotin/lipoyl-binding protein, partial [Bryobacteraceae bacterium]
MARTRFILILLIVVAAVLAWWIHHRSTRPVQIPFARVKRETLVSTLATNGKAEPSGWAAVRAQRPGSIQRVNVHLGQNVEQGALLAELDSRDARADL